MAHHLPQQLTMVFRIHCLIQNTISKKKLLRLNNHTHVSQNKIHVNHISISSSQINTARVDLGYVAERVNE